MENLPDTIKAHLYERIGNPFWGYFITSWMLWNYETVLTIFSGLTVKEKIFYIENHIYELSPDHSFYINIWNNSGFLFWHPLISTIMLMLIIPLLTIPLYAGWKWIQVQLTRIKTSIENKQPIHRETYEKLQLQYITTKRELNDEIQSQNTLIKELEKKLSELEKGSQNEKSTENKLTGTEQQLNFDKLDGIQAMVIKAFSDNDKYQYQHTLVKNIELEFDIKPTLIKNAVDKLLQLKILRHRGTELGFTTEGRDFAIQHSEAINKLTMSKAL